MTQNNPKLFVVMKAFIIHQGKVLLLKESSKYQDGVNSGRLWVHSLNAFPALSQVRLSADHCESIWIKPEDYKNYPLIENLIPAFESFSCRQKWIIVNSATKV